MKLNPSRAIVTALIFSALNTAYAADVCTKDSEGNWKTTKGVPCYMGQPQLGQPQTFILPANMQPPLIGAAALQAGATTLQTGQPQIVSNPVEQAPVWSVDLKDVTLANTFVRWAKVAGARVRWDAAKNVMVEAPTNYTGNFEDAITSALSSPGIANSEYPLEVCFYPNTPLLARITRKGDSRDCK